jgi:hypothetical protein
MLSLTDLGLGSMAEQICDLSLYDRLIVATESLCS